MKAQSGGALLAHSDPDMERSDRRKWRLGPHLGEKMGMLETFPSRDIKGPGARGNLMGGLLLVADSVIAST